MRFNSHVERLAVVTVALINALTPGKDGVSDVEVPDGVALRRVVASVVSRPGYVGACTLDEARRLLPWVHRCRMVVELLDGEHLAEAAEEINAMLADSGARPRLDPNSEGEGFGVHFHGLDDSFERGWAAGLAAGLAMAVGGDFAHRFGLCRAPGCDRVWVDFSKNAHRRFCSVRCQSRVKAAAHRSRAARRP